MEYREDPGRCRWLARGQMSRLVGSHNAENKPAQTARGSWPSGGGVQETDGHCRTQSDWAVLAIGGTAGAVQSTPLIPWCDQCLA